MISAAADFDEYEWLQAAASSLAFDCLADPEEDIYTVADGKPFIDEWAAAEDCNRRERGAW